jgi:hypothetical protein
MKFINSGNIDGLKKRADLRNLRFGNFNISTTRMEGFVFSTITGFDLQTSDFYLQKIRYNSVTDTFEYYDYLLLNATYKKTGYFEPYDFASAIDEGCYRLRAGGYYSSTIIYCKTGYGFTTYTTLYLSDYTGINLAGHDDALLIGLN